MQNLTELADKIDELNNKNAPLPWCDMRSLLCDNAALLAAALRVADAAGPYHDKSGCGCCSDTGWGEAGDKLDAALAALATLTSRGGGR